MSSTAPAVSIVIPTYDRSGPLRACLDLLARQSQPGADFEVVVVMDGSTDDTQVMLTSLRPPYRLRRKWQPNAGAAAARNHGAGLAQGEWLLFLDDDMQAEPQLVAAYLQAARAHGPALLLGQVITRLAPGADWFVQQLGRFGDTTRLDMVGRRTLLALHAPLAALNWVGRLTRGRDWLWRWYRFVFSYAYWRGVRGAMAREEWQRLTSGTVILMYHAFGAPGERASRYMQPARRFAQDMARLKLSGYNVISLDEYLERRQQHRLPPRRSVVITIDDGYVDNYTLALPILRRYGFPATIFLISQRIGRTNEWDRGVNLDLAGRPLLTREQIVEMRAAGISFGVHTRTHCSLPGKQPDILRAEIIGAREELEQQLGFGLSSFAYPYGETDDASRAMVVAASLALAPIFPYLFQVPPADAGTASRLVMLMGALMGLTLAGSITWTVLHGLQRFDLANLISTLTVVVTNIAIVLVVLLGGGVVALVTANIVMAMVMQGFAFWVMRRAAPELSLSLRGASWSEAKKIMRFGTALFVGRFAGRLKMETDQIVIGRVLSVAAITPYAVANRLEGLTQTLTYEFIKVVEPLASQLDAERDRAGLRALFLTSTRVTLAIFMPLACGLTILSRPFLSLWVGEAYANNTSLVLVLMLCVFLDTAMTPGILIVQGMARHQPLAWIALGSGIFNFVLSVILVQRLGLIGVALGTLIPTTLEVALLVVPYQLRTIGTRARDYLVSGCLPALLPALPLCLWLYAALVWIRPANWFALIWIGCVGAGLYGLVYLGMPGTGMERRWARAFASRLLERVRRREIV